jgi:hypothetical protein
VVKKKSVRANKIDRDWKPLLNGIFLVAWSILLLARFEIQLLGAAANTDGGVLFAMTITTLGYVLVAAALWVRGSWKSLPAYASALSGFVPLLLFEGARASAGDIFTLAAMPWYILANACFALLLFFWGYEEPQHDLKRSQAKAWIASLAVALLLGWAIYALRNWTFSALKVPSDKNSLSLFFNPRNGGGATDISARPFSEFRRLVAPLQYLGVVALAIFFYRKFKNLDERWIVLGLLLLAMLGKLSIAFLSDNGLDILGLKISSINTNYYNLVETLKQKGLWGYLSGYNALQQGQGAHGDTHPFGPIVFYSFLMLFLGKHPALIAVAISVLSALSAPLIYHIASRHYHSREAGVAAALVYLSSPISLILSGAGIDSIILLLLVSAFYFLQRGHEAPHWKWGLWAGAFFFLGSLFSFGVLLCLMFAGLWTLHARLRASRGVSVAMTSTALLWGPLLGAILLGHGLLYGALAGKFSYIQSMNTAQFIHRSMNQYRTYEMWSWANVVLFAGYAGVATLALWFIRMASALGRADKGDGFLLLSLPLILTLIFACMGRAEVQREFLFGILFLALPTAPFFLAKASKGASLRSWLLFGLVSLNVINAVVLEITVLDFW